MPRSPNEQVPHTATTLHLIPRFADLTESGSEMRPRSRTDDSPLIHFHRDEFDSRERSQVSRDLGIALASSLRSIPGTSPVALSRLALPLLEKSLAANPSDAPAWEAKGKVLWQLGRREESLAALRTALENTSDREETLVLAGTKASQIGRNDEALEHFTRAIKINPWRADYHQVVALAHAQRREWNAAIEAAKTSLRLNPSNAEARILLIQCLLKDRKTSEARIELQTLIDLDPPNRDTIEAWFARNLSH
jgi:tetratricopeptide (TPR) repeat protein